MNRPRLGPESGRHIGRLDANFTRRFWARVRKTDGCWIWLGARGVHGYGTINLPGPDRGPFPAHRVAFAIANGGCPAGKVVRHTCDEKPCVRPLHLLAGSQLENMHDAIARGRWSPTAHRPRAKARKCRVCGAPRDMGSRRALCAGHVAAEAVRDRASCEGIRRVTRRFDAPPSIDELITRIGERAALLLARNFGLYGHSPEKLREIGSDIGISGERVRQIVTNSLKKLGVEPRTFWGHTRRSA